MTDSSARLRRRLGVVMLAGLLGGALLVGSIMYGTVHVAAGSRGRIHAVDDIPATPIAMVLGARAHPDRPSAFLAARLELALRLWEQGKIRAVLVSGDDGEDSNFQTRVMRDYLVAHGIPAEKVVEDPAGLDTYDSCVRARDVYGVEQMVVLSQEYHLARALTICNAIGIDAVGAGDVTIEDRFPLLYRRSQVREWFANLKMEWDLLSRRQPRQDEFDPSLLEAAGLTG